MWQTSRPGHVDPANTGSVSVCVWLLWRLVLNLSILFCLLKVLDILQHIQALDPSQHGAVGYLVQHTLEHIERRKEEVGPEVKHRSDEKHKEVCFSIGLIMKHKRWALQNLPCPSRRLYCNDECRSVCSGRNETGFYLPRRYLEQKMSGTCIYAAYLLEKWGQLCLSFESKRFCCCLFAERFARCLLWVIMYHR